MIFANSSKEVMPLKETMKKWVLVSCHQKTCIL